MITSLYAAFLALMFIGLSVYVILGRGAAGVALGQGEFLLLRRVRAQGNFAEYAPMFLLLLALAEMQSLVVWAVHGFGLVFMLGRALHAFSLLKHERYVDGKLVGFPLFRVAGMMLTFGCISGLALVLLVGQFTA